jgi:hypothetical protein
MKQEEDDWIVNILVCLYWFVLQIVTLLKIIMFSQRQVWTEYIAYHFCVDGDDGVVVVVDDDDDDDDVVVVVVVVVSIVVVVIIVVVVVVVVVLTGSSYL